MEMVVFPRSLSAPEVHLASSLESGGLLSKNLNSKDEASQKALTLRVHACGWELMFGFPLGEARHACHGSLLTDAGRPSLCWTQPLAGSPTTYSSGLAEGRGPSGASHRVCQGLGSAGSARVRRGGRAHSDILC